MGMDFIDIKSEKLAYKYIEKIEILNANLIPDAVNCTLLRVQPQYLYIINK